MGRGIALAFAYSGHAVDLVDLKSRPAGDSVRLEEATRQELRRDLRLLEEVGAIEGGGIKGVMARIRFTAADSALERLSAADIVFEAVPETLTAKRTTLQALAAAARVDALIASTTSTFDADVLAGFLAGPERFANAHWLNLAHLMPLVEVSPCKHTAREPLDRLLGILRSIGKVPVVCRSSPGYIVPRIQALAMNEAARMVEEGVASAEDIDTAVRVGFGLRFAVLGLLEFIDWGGGDVLYYASRNLAASLSPERFATPQIVERNMQQKRRGLRDGQGFFDYVGRDVDRYREERLAALIALLRHRNLMPVSAGKAPAVGEPR